MRVNNNSRVKKAYKVVREFNPEEMNELIKLLKEDKEARKRELIPLMDAKKVEALFYNDVEPLTGELIKSDVEKANNNFTNLYRHISRCITPTATNKTGDKSIFRLYHTALKDYTNDEFNIVKEAMRQIINTMYAAKMDIEKLKRE